MGEKTDGHLFVLVHGLWGGASHLTAVEQAVKSTITSSKEKLCTIRPKSSAFFKTYDGIEIIGDRMLKEVFREIDTLLKSSGVKITKISFVGYSLGGLVSRYMIGELERMGFFDTVEPVFFTTFATPHLGTYFFKKSLKFLGVLGQSLLGLAGKELFIVDSSNILVELSEGCYIRGLGKFRKRFLFANIRNDRTVSFYTSYITNKNPFEENWDAIKVKYAFEEDFIPSYTVRDTPVKPFIVNMRDSGFRSTKRKNPIDKKLKRIAVLFGLSLILPIWIPLIFTASFIGTCVSYVVVKTYKKSPFKLENMEDLNQESLGNKFKQQLDDTAGTILEEFLNINDFEDRIESNSTSSSVETTPMPPEIADEGTEILYDKYVKASNLKLRSLAQSLSIFESSNISEYEIFRKASELPLDSKRKKILDNLGELEWTKFAVFVDTLNAHDGIIARRGLESGSEKGISIVYFWGELINQIIEAH